MIKIIKKKWQGIPRFSPYLLHEMIQRSPKQHLPLLLHVVQTIDMILCHDSIFETLGRHNINKTEKK